VVIIVVFNICIELRAKIYCKTISVHMLAYQNRIKIHYLSNLKRPGKNSIIYMKKVLTGLRLLQLIWLF